MPKTMKFFDENGKEVSLFSLTPDELFSFKGSLDIALRKHLVGDPKQTVSVPLDKTSINMSPRLLDRLEKLEDKDGT